jgi:hypothetical protein
MKSATGPPRKYERFHPADFGPFPADFGSFLASDPAEPRCKRTCEHRQDSKLLLDSADQQRDLSVQRLIEVREHRAIVLEDPRSRVIPVRKARDRLDLVAQGPRDFPERVIYVVHRPV